MLMPTPGSILRTSILLMVFAGIAVAQTTYVRDAPGRWKPWSIEVQNAPYGALRFTAAEIRALEAQMRRLDAILRVAPGVATPVGYSAQTAGVITSSDVVTGQPDPRALPLPSSLSFGAFGITEFTRNGKTVREDGGETSLLLFWINKMPTGHSVPDFIDLESDVMLELPRRDDVHGMRRDGDLLLLHTHAAPLFVPVTRTEALRLTVRALELRVNAARKTLATWTKALADWRDPKQQAQRIADFTQAAALGKDPTMVPKMTAFEKTHDADLARLASPDGAAAREVHATEADVAAATTAIAALSPSERDAASCFVTDPRALAPSPSHIRSATSPGCVPIVRPNWAFFDATLPRTVPQLLVIDRFAGCVDYPLPNVPGNCAANKALIDSLDVAAVRAWLH